MKPANVYHHDFTMPSTTCRRRDQYQVTEWAPPYEVLDHTQYGGPLTYERWCNCEIMRWANKWDFGVWVAQGQDKYHGQIALFAYRTADTKPVVSAY